MDSNSHLLSATYIMLSRIAFFSSIKVIVSHSQAHILRRIPKIGRKIIEYSCVSGQCRQILLYCIVYQHCDTEKSNYLHAIMMKQRKGRITNRQQELKETTQPNQRPASGINPTHQPRD